MTEYVRLLVKLNTLEPKTFFQLDPVGGLYEMIGPAHVPFAGAGALFYPVVKGEVNQYIVRETTSDEYMIFGGNREVIVNMFSHEVRLWLLAYDVRNNVEEESI